MVDSIKLNGRDLKQHFSSPSNFDLDGKNGTSKDEADVARVLFVPPVDPLAYAQAAERLLDAGRDALTAIAKGGDGKTQKLAFERSISAFALVQRLLDPKTGLKLPSFEKGGRVVTQAGQRGSALANLAETLKEDLLRRKALCSSAQEGMEKSQQKQDKSPDKDDKEVRKARDEAQAAYDAFCGSGLHQVQTVRCEVLGELVQITELDYHQRDLEDFEKDCKPK